MEIILLERVAKLGALASVKVKDGFARNFLLRRGKALRATDANRAKFETQRAVLEAKNAERRKGAQDEAKALMASPLLSSARPGIGPIYGSVCPRDIAKRPPPPVWPSNAAMCCWIRRSRPLECIR